MSAMNWTSKWPIEPGYYWFYGWRFDDRDNPANFHYVRVHRITNGIAYITDGHFLYRGEGGGGIWQLGDFPELPQWVHV